jgi:D-lyxose ketol-isomerase
MEKHMLTRKLYREVCDKALPLFEKAGIVLTDEERENLEVAEYALDEVYRTGLELVTYINTKRVCAKELVLLPGQTCPEHRHPDVDGERGKEETFRCRYGTVCLYVEGEPAPNITAVVPEGSEPYYTVFHEVILKPGMQHTIMPDTLHWFQAGPEGAVVSEFSTRSRDESDIFTDVRIKRMPEIID